MELLPLEAFAVCFPVFAIVLVSIALAIYKFKELLRKRKRHWRQQVRVFTSNAVLGFAFLPLAVMYRPSLIEAVKAQVRQDEDVDEGDNGDPDSPLKHLLRQLRRIRRGEKVEAITLRLE
jgi:hypothetical protein